MDDLNQRNAQWKITVKHRGTRCCLAKNHTLQIASGSCWMKAHGYEVYDLGWSCVTLAVAHCCQCLQTEAWVIAT